MFLNLLLELLQLLAPTAQAVEDTLTELHGADDTATKVAKIASTAAMITTIAEKVATTPTQPTS